MSALDRLFRAAQRHHDNASEPSHDYRVTTKMIRCQQCGEWKPQGDDPNVCDDCLKDYTDKTT
jgi:hypothetical protein